MTVDPRPASRERWTTAARVDAPGGATAGASADARGGSTAVGKGGTHGTGGADGTYGTHGTDGTDGTGGTDGSGRAAAPAAAPSAMATVSARAPATRRASGAAADRRGPAPPPAVGDRYARQRLLAGWSQDALAAAHVLVIGAGAIGNEAIAQLAMMGVGRLTVVDMDAIEASNLARTVLFRPADLGANKAEVAAAAAAALNPDIRANALPQRFERAVGEGLLRTCDVAIGAVDNLAARDAINRRCLRAGVPWVDAGIDERAISVQVIDPNDGACFECGLPASARARLAARHSCADRLLVAARQRVVPTVAPVAAIAGALAAKEAVALIHAASTRQPGGGEPLPRAADDARAGGHPPGTQLYLDIETWCARAIRRSRSARCTAHAPRREPTRLRVGADATLAAIADAALAATRDADVDRGPSDDVPATTDRDARCHLYLVLDEPVVIALACPACGETETVGRPFEDVGRASLRCPCGGLREVRAGAEIPLDARHGALRAADLGVPPRGWVAVRDAAAAEVWVELAG